jgi:tetratricopeptide (TPR) repeat protein
MFRIAFALLTTLQAISQPAPPDEIKDALAHAESLYYGAHFNESIALLTRIDDALTAQPGRLQEKADTKLRLALASIGLNDTVKAKSFFMGLYALEPDYALDVQQFSPKVIAVAGDAKLEQTKVRCNAAQTEARAYLDKGQTTAFLDLFRSSGSKCTALSALTPEAAETLYRAGIASSKRGEFSSALSSFTTAEKLAPQHEMARNYAHLTRSYLQVGDDRLFVQWQRNFGAHQFTAAAADYREITSENSSRDTAKIAYVTGEYRKALSSLVENWNRTCFSADAATLRAISGQISELLPEPSFGGDIRAQMTSCEEAKKPASTNNTAAEVQAEAAIKAGPAAGAATAKADNISGCLEMPAQLALARLKTRVDPVITSDLRNYLKNSGEIVARVKARINESGDVIVTGMPNGNPILNTAVRGAVTQWKFVPIRDASGSRCVDTEIPINLKFRE